MKFKYDRVLNLLSLLANILTVVLVTASTLVAMRGDDGTLRAGGFQLFVFFTEDSNVFAALTALIMAVFNILSLRKDGLEAPEWLHWLKFCSAVAVTVTLLTTALFLGPIYTYRYVFGGENLYLHLLCPVLAVISTLVFEPRRRIGPWLPVSLCGTLPVVVYGIVYFINVVVLGPEKGGWEDFYMFNMGGRWYITMAIMFAGTFLLSSGMRLLRNFRRS